MRLSWAALFVVSTLTFTACRHSDSFQDRVARLSSDDPSDRRSAADALRANGGPPQEAVPYLFQAISHERDAGAYGAMMITLGASGVPQAKPLIEANLRSSSASIRRWAGTAMDYWVARNGGRPRRGGVYIYVSLPRHHKPAPPPEQHPEQPQPPPPPLPAGPQPTPEPPPESDGCQQFAQACGADPFDVERCKRDLASWQDPALEAWAACSTAQRSLPKDLRRVRREGARSTLERSQKHSTRSPFRVDPSRTPEAVSETGESGPRIGRRAETYSGTLSTPTDAAGRYRRFMSGF